MARVWNPATREYEEDGQPDVRPTSPPIVADFVPNPVARPLNGRPIDTAPDEVYPSDLAPVHSGGFTGSDAPFASTEASTALPDPAPEPAPGTSVGDALIANTDKLDANAQAYRASLGAAVPPAAPVAPSGPPPMVVTGTSNTTQTSQKVMTDEEKAAQAALGTTAMKEEELAGKRADKEKELAAKNLQITQQANKNIADAQADTDRQVAAQEKAISQLENIVTAKRAQLEARPLRSFFVGKRPAAEFVAAISGAVGAYVAVRSGSGRNFAKESIDKAIDRDFKEQAFLIEHDKELLNLAKQDVQAATLKKTAMLHELQIKKVGLLDVADRMRSEELAAHGVKTADIAKDEKILAIRKKRQEEEAELWKGLRKDVTKSSTVQRQPMPTGAGGLSENSIIGPDGKPLGMAPDKKVAQEASAGIAGYTNFTRAAKKYRNMIRDNGSEFSGAGAGKMNAIQTELLLAVRDSNTGLGSLDKGLQEVVEKLVPTASGWTGTFSNNARMVAQLDEAMRLADQKLQTRLASAGVGNPAIAADIRKRALMSSQ